MPRDVLHLLLRRVIRLQKQRKEVVQLALAVVRRDLGRRPPPLVLGVDARAVAHQQEHGQRVANLRGEMQRRFAPLVEGVV